MDKSKQFFLFVSPKPNNLAFFEPTVKVDNETVRTPFQYQYKEGSTVCLQPQQEVGSSMFLYWKIDGVEEKYDRVLVVDMNQHHTIEMVYAPSTESLLRESIAAEAQIYVRDFETLMEERAWELGGDEVDRLIASGDIITPDKIPSDIRNGSIAGNLLGAAAVINRSPLKGAVADSNGIVIGLRSGSLGINLGTITIPSGTPSVTVTMGINKGIRVRIGPGFARNELREDYYLKWGVFTSPFTGIFARWKVDGIPSASSPSVVPWMEVKGGTLFSSVTFDCEFMVPVLAKISPDGCSDTSITMSPADQSFMKLPATAPFLSPPPNGNNTISESVAAGFIINAAFTGNYVKGFYLENQLVTMEFLSSGIDGARKLSCDDGIEQGLTSATVNNVEHLEHPIAFTVGNEGKSVNVVANYGDSAPGGPGVLTFRAQAGSRPLPDFNFNWSTMRDGSEFGKATFTDANGERLIEPVRVGDPITISVVNIAVADAPNFSGQSGFIGWRFGPGDEPPAGNRVEDDPGGGRRLTFTPTDGFTSESIEVTALYGPIGEGVTLQRTGVDMDIPVRLLRLSTVSDGADYPEDGLTPTDGNIGGLGVSFFPNSEFATGFAPQDCIDNCDTGTIPPGLNENEVREECRQNCKRPTYEVIFPNLVRCEGDDFRLENVGVVLTNEAFRGDLPAEFPASPSTFGETIVGVDGVQPVTLVANYGPASVPYPVTLSSDPADSVDAGDFSGAGLQTSNRLFHIDAPLVNKGGGRFVRWEILPDAGEGGLNPDEGRDNGIPTCPTDDTDLGAGCYFVTGGGHASPATEAVSTRPCEIRAVYDDAEGESGSAGERATITLKANRANWLGCSDDEFAKVFLGAQLSAAPEDPDDPGNARIVVTASPRAADGAAFSSWAKSGSGSFDGSTSSSTVVFEPSGTDDATLTALYTGGNPCGGGRGVSGGARTVTLASGTPTTLTLGGSEVTGATSVTGTFGSGSRVSIKAAPNADNGRPFLNWSGVSSDKWVQGGSSVRESVFVVLEDITVTANYETPAPPPPPETGACIDRITGLCTQTTEAQCSSSPENDFRGIGTPCPDEGGCILPDGTCVVTTEANCVGREGVFRGDGTGCAPSFLTIEFLADPAASATVEGSTDGVVFKPALGLPDDELFDGTVLNIQADAENSGGRRFDAWVADDGADTGTVLEYDSDTLNGLLAADDTKVYGLFRVGPAGGTVTARYQRTFTLDSNPPGAEIAITRDGEPFDPAVDGFSDGDRLVLRAPSVFGGNNFILWTITSPDGESRFLSTPGAPEVEIEVFGDTTVTANYQTLAPATITLVSTPAGTVSDSFPAAVGDTIQPGSTLLDGVAPLLTDFGQPFLRWELSPGDPGSLLNPGNRLGVTLLVSGDATLIAVYDPTLPHPADTVEPPSPDFRITPLESLHYYDAGVNDADWPILPNDGGGGPLDSYTAKGNELYRTADGRYFWDPSDSEPASWKPSLLIVDSTTDYDLEGPQGGDFVLAGDTFPFGATARSFTFTNRTELNIRYRISTEAWLALTPVSQFGGADGDGSIRNVLVPGETHEISVDVNDNAKLLSVGISAGTIVFENVTPGLDGVGTVAVNANINVGTAMVTPLTGLVGDGAEGGPFTPSQRIYTITNNFGGPINYDAAVTEPWLDLDGTPGPASVGGTIAASNSVQVTIDVNAAADSLVPNEYSGTVVFQNTSNNIGNTVRRVDLTVLPHLLVEPEGDYFSAGRNGDYNPPGKEYTVTNTTEGSIDFDVAVVGEPWLTVTDEPEFITTPPPTTSPPGFLAPGGSRVVTASINPNADALPEGPALEQLSFTTTSGGGSGNTTRDVTLEIVPTMSVRPIGDLDSTATVGGGPDPTFRDYTVRNTGDASIDYSISKTQSFVTIDDNGTEPEPTTTVPPGPLTGTLDPGESVIITVRVDPDTSSVALFSDTVTFTNLTDGDGDTTRDVTVDVIEPILVPDTDFASEGPAGGPFDPATETYTVQNETGGPFDYTVTHFLDFVSLTDGGGTGGAPVVGVDPDTGLTTVAGTLADGENRDIVVGFNDNAGALEDANDETTPFGDTLFVTTDAGLSDTRDIELGVDVPLVTPAADRTATGAEGGPFELDGIPNPGSPDWVRFGDFEYTLTDEASTWVDSFNKALALGGILTDIDSQEENDFLLEQFTRAAWIGLTLLDGSRVWVDDRSLPTFTNYATGAPDGRAYVAMNVSGLNGKWTDTPNEGYAAGGYRGIVKRAVSDNPRPVYAITNNLALPILISTSVDVGWVDVTVQKSLPGSENLLVNPGAETGDILPWVETDGSYTSRGPGATSANPFAGPLSGDKFFGPPNGPIPTAEMEQEIDLLALGFSEGFLDSGVRVVSGGWQNSYSGDDDGRITVQFLDAPGGTVLDSFVGPHVAPFPNWEVAFDSRALPAGTRAVNYIFTSERHAGTNNNSYLDDAFVFFRATAVGVLSLDPGETAFLDASFNGNANVLAAGQHTATVTITNVTTDEGTTTRDIVLTVVEAPITPQEPFGSSGPRVDGEFSGPAPDGGNAGTAAMSFGPGNGYTGTGTAAYTVTVPAGATTVPPTTAPGTSVPPTTAPGTTVPPTIELGWASTLGTFGTVVVSSGEESEVELGITIVVDDIDLLADGDIYGFAVTMTPLFEPDSKTYTITNSGSPVFAYRVEKSQPWLSIAAEAPEFLTTPPPMTTAPPVFGDGPLIVIVNPNQSVDVTVAINEVANALPIGLVGDTLEFTEPLPEELNTVVNCCADDLDLAGWVPAGAGTWLTTSSGVNAPVALPLNKLSTTAFKSPIDGGTGTYTLTQDVDLETAGFTASVLDSGIATQVGVDVRIHSSQASTTARVQIWYYDGDPGGGGSIIDSFDSGTLVGGTGGLGNGIYEQFGESRPLPVGTRFIRMRFSNAVIVNSFGRHARFTNAFVLLATETPAETSRAVSLDVHSGLRVVPQGDFDTGGGEGGTAYDPEFKEYAVTNQTPDPLDYTVTAIGSPAWIGIDDEPLPLVPTTPPPASGTLSPGESRLITVFIVPAQAALLSEGVFVTAIEFADITNGATAQRDVNLTILPQMTVVSEDDFFSFGPEGLEEFVPASKSYTVKNQGAVPITYEATKGAAWLDLAAAGPDILAPGATVTVIVSINQTQASALLAAGSPFTDTVLFTNLTNGSGDTARVATLTVEA